MSTISLELPESLHKRLREIAARENVPLERLVASAVAEKLTALESEGYLAQRAARGSRRKFEDVLRDVPDVEPPEGDAIPGPP